MLEPMGDYEQLPDWQETADVLLGIGLMLNPSELHGAVTALLASGVSAETDDSRDVALGLLEKALAVDLHGEAADFAAVLMRGTLSAARDADLAFEPLLPADDETFETRLLSMSKWASGFLTGYTQAVAAADAAAEPVDPTIAESLKDFAAIAQVDVDEQESDESERELEELTAYLRVAALTMVTDAMGYQE